jgi:hypothetical protein
MLLLARLFYSLLLLLSLENNFLHPHTSFLFFSFGIKREEKKRFSSSFDIKEIRDRKKGRVLLLLSCSRARPASNPLHPKNRDERERIIGWKQMVGY